MCIERSKWELSLRLVVAHTAHNWFLVSLLIKPSRSTMWFDASLANDFGQLLYALAIKHGLHQAKQVVALGDGAAWIWRLVAEHFPDAVQIVDLYHAHEHIWKIARAVFGPNT